MEAERFVGGKTDTNEKGLGARSVHSDENEFWECHCGWSKKWWDEEVARKVKKLMQNHEKGHHSAVESDCGEPKSSEMMMKRPQWGKQKWLEGTEKKFNDFNARGM